MKSLAVVGTVGLAAGAAADRDDSSDRRRAARGRRRRLGARTVELAILVTAWP